MNKNILICGVGGQGTVLASRIIAAAAMEEGHPVHSAETIGMAQRGGSVTSHIRIGESAYSPLLPWGSADILMAFEPAEAVRNLKYLKKGGVVTEAVRPTGYDGSEMTAWLRDKCACIFVDAHEVCRPFGSEKFFNVIMLGIAAGSGQLFLSKDTLLRQLKKQIPPRYLDINLQAFLAGYEIGTQKSK